MVNLTVNPLRFTLFEVLDHRRDPGLVRDLSQFEQPNGVALLLDPGKNTSGIVKCLVGSICQCSD